MSSPVLDCWALELQQFDIQFKHILGKRNIVAHAISQFRTLGLYQNNGNDDITPTENVVVKNVVEEVHAIKLVPNLPSYNMGKLNSDFLQVEQRQDEFCINKVRSMRTNQDKNFMFNENNIPRKAVKLRYTIEPTIVVPRKLTSLLSL